MDPHRGWYQSRNLPHFDSADVYQAVTFRLADSLPREAASSLLGETPDESRRRMGKLLDRGLGACLLRRPEVADVIASTLLHGHGNSYGLEAWVIMPNHVHALVWVKEGQHISRIVQGWKAWSAREINRLTGETGSVWQRDYFDRFMRDEKQFGAAVQYIENNPVKAGLCARSEDWRHSSAARRER